MDNIFAIDSIGKDGPFVCDDGLHNANMLVTFFRRASELDDVGQTILSFTSHITVRGSFQPEGEYNPHQLYGTQEEASVKFIIGFNADVQIMDRCYVSSQAFEVINVDHWGLFQTEVLLNYVR